MVGKSLSKISGAVAAATALLIASPAAAHATGGADFRYSGVYIRSCPITCSANGQGFPGQGATLHCWTAASDGYNWIYLTDDATRVSGWSRSDLLVIPGGWDQHC